METIKWLKDCVVRRDKQDKKYLESTEITKDYTDVKKEDVLNGMEYEYVSQLQQMLYHSFKKIDDLESRLIILEEK